jgi:hypothetical protein
MKSRTVTQRNLAGGFLGGMFGMLAFGYLNTGMLPVGCLLGVVIGWWYEVIGQAITNSTMLGVVKVKHGWQIVLGSPIRKLSEIEVSFSPATRFLGNIVAALLVILSLPLLWVAPLARFYRWLRARRTRRWVAIRVVATLLFFALNCLWAIPAWQNVLTFEKAEKGSATELFVTLNFFGTLMSTIILSMLPPIFAFIDRRRDDNYRSYSYFCMHSTTRSVLNELRTLFYMEVLVVLMVGLMLAWFGVAGMAFVIIFIVPIAAVIGLAKGVYVAATRAGHWLCFGVTLVVTALSAWLVPPHIGDNPYILWIVAMATGALSGIATEGVRRLLVLWLEKARLNWLVTEPIANRLRSGCVAFGRWTENTFGTLQSVA